jgi:hypothetical protein
MHVSILRTLVVCAALAAGVTVRAQPRFEAITRDTVAVVPGLEIVTIRDKAANACYTLFVMRPAGAVQTMGDTEFTSVEQAAARRDQRLSALSTEFEHSLATAVPGTLGPDVLKYQWEGQNVQSDFEHVLREAELGKLATLLRQIAGAPKLAVAGPAPCSAQTRERQ